ALQLPFALAGLDVLFRIETGKMLADDLVGGIALEALGSGVPRRNVSGRVENEDGVVLHRGDQKPKPLLASSQVLVGALSLAQIARDLAETNEAPGAISERRDHHIGPKTRTVLPDTPPFFFEAPLVGGGLELQLTFAGADLVRRVEDREVSADDLRRRVPVHALGARIPGDDAAADVEHEDAVIDDALDEQAKPVLAFLDSDVTLLGPGPGRGILRQAIAALVRHQRNLRRPSRFGKARPSAGCGRSPTCSSRN